MSNTVNTEKVDIMAVDSVWNIFHEVVPDVPDAAQEAVQNTNSDVEQWVASAVTCEVITDEVHRVMQDVLWDIALHLDDNDTEEHD